MATPEQRLNKAAEEVKRIQTVLDGVIASQQLLERKFDAVMKVVDELYKSKLDIYRFFLEILEKDHNALKANGRNEPVTNQKEQG